MGDPFCPASLSLLPSIHPYFCPLAWFAQEPLCVLAVWWPCSSSLAGE
jgi:hypothetical protein